MFARVEFTCEVFERKILRRIFGPQRNNEGKYVIRSNRNLEELYNELGIVRSLKSVRISWAGHVWRSKALIGRITAWKPHTKRPRRRRTVKEDLKMSRVRNAEETAKDRGKWRQVVVAAMSQKGL